MERGATMSVDSDETKIALSEQRVMSLEKEAQDHIDLRPTAIQLKHSV